MELLQDRYGLPDEIMGKIMLYAHPTLLTSVSTELKVGDIRGKFQDINDVWYELAVEAWRSSNYDFITEYAHFRQHYSRDEIEDVLNTLLKCNCCVRHSNLVVKGVCHVERNAFYDKTRVQSFAGSSYYKVCRCSCRHDIRHILHAQYALEI